MRKTLIMLLLLTVAVTHLAAKDDDPDARFVKVTLKDGKTVEGWLPKKNRRLQLPVVVQVVQCARHKERH